MTLGVLITQNRKKKSRITSKNLKICQMHSVSAATSYCKRKVLLSDLETPTTE